MAVATHILRLLFQPKNLLQFKNLNHPYMTDVPQALRPKTTYLITISIQG